MSQTTTGHEPPSPDGISVDIRTGSDFEPSDQLRNTLENLSTILADEYGADVEGFNQFDASGLGDPLGFCLIKFTGGGGCSKVRCSGTYTPGSGPSTGSGGGGGTSSDGGDTIPVSIPGLPRI